MPTRAEGEKHMNQYESIYAGLERLVGGDLYSWLASEQPLKLKAPGFMDLHIDILTPFEGEDARIALAHNYVQEGDVMADPDMEIAIYHAGRMAEALTFQQDPGIYHEVYEYDDDGRKVRVNIRMKIELNTFLVQWLKNLKMQGHKREE